MLQVVVIERIAKQIVDVPMTIPQSEELVSLLYLEHPVAAAVLPLLTKKSGSASR